MGDISRVALFGKLNGLGYKAVEGATVFCKLRGNPYVELVHWINQILQLQNSDLHCIVRAFNIDPSRLARDVTAALDRLPRGASSIIGFVPAHPGFGAAGVGMGDAQVRRLLGAHRLCGGGHPQHRGAQERLSGDFKGI